MSYLQIALVAAGVFCWLKPDMGAAATRAPIRLQQASLAERYLGALRNAQYGHAFMLLDGAERRYYRQAENFASIYAADSYRLTAYRIVESRGDDIVGRVFFARETAVFRDHASDADLRLTATVPIGVVPEAGGWRVKDPGHPWRAFATRASVTANGVSLRVKKLSFFANRVEAVVSFANVGPRFVTILAYGRSLLRDPVGRPCRLIDGRDWSVTDKTLFEGLRLAPNARYTGTLSFRCAQPDAGSEPYALTVAPLLRDGADSPFALGVPAIGPSMPPK